jgi:hypothetical protein
MHTRVLAIAQKVGVWLGIATARTVVIKSGTRYRGTRVFINNTFVSTATSGGTGMVPGVLVHLCVVDYGRLQLYKQYKARYLVPTDTCNNNYAHTGNRSVPTRVLLYSVPGGLVGAYRPK